MQKLGALGLVLALVIVAFSIAFPTHSYRYRLTISAEVDGEVRSASSVIEIRSRKQIKIGDAPPYDTKVLGEAAFLDLGNGKNVIAILAFGPTGNSDRLQFLVSDVFGVSRPEIWENLSKADEERVLTGDNIPTLVTFADVGDPESGRVVKPEDFTKEFGNGVRFVGARIQMTRDSLASDIENHLPMLVTHRDYMWKLSGHPKRFTPQHHLFIRS
jgi:hypothetical protein